MRMFFANLRNRAVDGAPALPYNRNLGFDCNLNLNKLGARTAIISVNGSRRVFLLRALVFQQRDATPAPSF